MDIDTWFAGNASLEREIVLNILLFVPFGFSMALITKKNWAVIVAALALTIATEILQLVFGLGLFEWDDIINNTLGAVIGGDDGKGIPEKSIQSRWMRMM